MLDLYHAQIGEGNLIELCRQALPYIGAIQVADVPGRCEPGTGEINYPAIARALADMSYDGIVGLEGWASGDPATALDAFRAAFTVAQAQAVTAVPGGDWHECHIESDYEIVVPKSISWSMSA